MNIKHFVLWLFIISLFGCASYSKKGFKEDYIKLNNDNLIKINGTFNFYPIKSFNNSNRHISSLKNMNLYQNITNTKWEGKKIDSLLSNTKHYSIRLNLKNHSELSIKIFDNSKLLKEVTLTGKLKKRMFYLNNKDLEIKGIPFLFGSYKSNKRRIGLTKNNNLIVNTAIRNEVGILILLTDGYQYNSAYEYERAL